MAILSQKKKKKDYVAINVIGTTSISKQMST